MESVEVKSYPPNRTIPKDLLPHRMKQILAFALAVVTCCSTPIALRAAPNIVILFADDLGYGDLGCYGSPTIRTPHLDRMAAEGIRFTDFYSASEVCTPSRAGLLTGRYPIRSGMVPGPTGRRVLFPDSAGGLPANETTIAEVLQAKGYATHHVGKWHLGIHPGSRPQDQGFDHSFGFPYSNDMDPIPGLAKGSSGLADPPLDGWNVPLMRDGKILEQPVDQRTLTKRYTEEAVTFLRENKERPFFLYLAHSFPHVPLFASDEYRGRSRGGIYGDAVEEIDGSTGTILDTLREEGLAENTLVLFTSDNGPWLTMHAQGGSAGPLTDGKGSTWEGGMRVPGILWMPGQIEPRVSSAPVSTLDILPTVLNMAKAEVPNGTILDGQDLTPLLFDGKTLPDRPFFYYRGNELYACRIGEWKANFVTRTGYGPERAVVHQPPLLHHLGLDSGEIRDLGSQHSEILTTIQEAVEKHRAGVVPAVAQLP